MLRFEFINSQQQFLDLAPTWQRLSRESATPLQFFQEWHWISSWWKIMSPIGNYQLKVLVASLDHDVVMIWPWVVKQTYGLRILEPMGGLMSCFDDALIMDTQENKGILESAWTYLVEQAEVDVIELRAVHEQANIASLMHSVGNTPVKSTVASVIDVQGYEDFDSYLASRSKKMRQNQRRSLRSLRQLGEVRASGDDREISVDLALDTCLEFKSQWLKARGLSGKTLVTDEALRFLKEIGNHYRQNSRDAGMGISTLYLDENLISLGIGFRYQNYHFEYLAGFDYEYEHFGPGRLGMEYGIRDCFEKKFSGFDMLTPATPFKKIWTENTPKVAHYIMPASLRGKLYRDLYVRRLRPRLKQVYKSLPSIVKSRMLPGRIWG